MGLRLPESGIIKVMGLLEVIHDNGGEEDTVKIVDELHMDVDSLLPVTEASELLGLIKVSGGKIRLTDDGGRVVKADIAERKKIIADKLLTLDAFKKTLQLMEGKKGRRIPKKLLVKAIRGELIRLQADKTVTRIIDWGRHAGLLGYDSDSDEIYLISK